MTAFTENWQEILTAFGVTIEMVIVAGLIAFVVGSIMAALRVSPIPLGRAIGSLYVRIIRNTPLLLIMLIFVFGLPELEIRPEVRSDTELLDFNVFFIFATTALGLYTAAFVCEALRSGINAIPLGQAEAARSIGMTFGQTLRNVILPQSFRTVVPPLASAMIAMTKNSSVALGVGVTEATFVMKKLTNDYPTELFAIFIGFAIGYMILVALISLVASIIERRLAVA